MSFFSDWVIILPLYAAALFCCGAGDCKSPCMTVLWSIAISDCIRGCRLVSIRGLNIPVALNVGNISTISKKFHKYLRILVKSWRVHWLLLAALLTIITKYWRHCVILQISVCLICNTICDFGKAQLWSGDHINRMPGSTKLVKSWQFG